MPPTSSRDFQRVATAKLLTSELLLRADFTLDAHYFGGYAVECSLKALILHLTPDADRDETLKRITSGAKMHRAEVLLELLEPLGVRLPRAIRLRMRRFDWTTDLRYETGRRDLGETKGFLKTVKMITKWVEERLP